MNGLSLLLKTNKKPKIELSLPILLTGKLAMGP